MRFPQADLSGFDTFNRQWPVGSVVTLYGDDDPAVLFGYGVWTEIGQGRFLVGKDSGQAEFDAVGNQGGAKDVTLTAAQSGLPQHTHPQDPHTHTQNAHSHVQTVNSATTGGTSGYAPDTSTNNGVASGYSTQQTTAVNQNATATNQNAGPASAAQSHTNLPPFEVVRRWRRAA